jgi:prepilin-type processing-associated H-X9-DG protein
MPRRNEDDYDDDDRPRRRRDDDDDYDRPRRKRAQSGGGGSWIALIIAGVVLGGCLVFGGLGLLLFPAMQKVRGAAARVQDQNNMKQIVLAMHNQASAIDGFAGPYAVDKSGTPCTGLSWRVGILPYMEYQNVYNQFDLKETWDSSKNKPASNTTVKTYWSPLTSSEPGGTTTPYRVFYGGGALFNEDGKPVRIPDIKDGTSNTIMAVHATEQVPWAEPREFKYSATMPLPKLGPANSSMGTNVAMADGSVRILTDKVSERTLRNAITRSGGEPLDLDW